jgi:hypothetical protein
MHCGHFLIYCASPSEFQSFLIHSPELSGKYRQRHLAAKKGETWQEMSLNFAGEVYLSYSTGIFTCRKILRHGDNGFTPRPKEVMIWIFIALKNLSSLAWFEPVNLGTNGKYDNN